MIAMVIILIGDIIYGGSAILNYNDQIDLVVGIIMLFVCFLSFSA